MKVLYIIGALFALVATYFLITAMWSSLYTPAIQIAVNATDNTTYPFANSAIRTMPIWLYILPAYKQPKPITLRHPPIGFVGSGTPAETIQIIGESQSKVPHEVNVDLGFADILITDGKTIQFSGNGLGTDVGARMASPTMGMSVMDADGYSHATDGLRLYNVNCGASGSDGVNLTATYGFQIIGGTYNLNGLSGINVTDGGEGSILGSITDQNTASGVNLYSGRRISITGSGYHGGNGWGIILDHNTTLCTVTSNYIADNSAIGVLIQDGSTGNIVTANPFYNNTGGDISAIPGNLISGNTPYIAPCEIRTYSGTLTGGAQNTILFAWHDPEAQDVFITKVVVNITTADADGANIDVGIADDATYTNGGTEFFNDWKGETIQVNDSLVTTEHTQTVWVLCQDSVSATDGWVVAKILDNDGTSIVGSYYIEVVGK